MNICDCWQFKFKVEWKTGGWIWGQYNNVDHIVIKKLGNNENDAKMMALSEVEEKYKNKNPTILCENTVKLVKQPYRVFVKLYLGNENTVSIGPSSEKYLTVCKIFDVSDYDADSAKKLAISIAQEKQFEIISSVVNKILPVVGVTADIL